MSNTFLPEEDAEGGDAVQGEVAVAQQPQSVEECHLGAGVHEQMMETIGDGLREVVDGVPPPLVYQVGQTGSSILKGQL